MKKIRVLIIDDEPAAVDVIKELASQLAQDIVIEGIAMNGVDAVQAIIQHKPDLIFLDVDMPLMNGMQVIEKIPFTDLKIIFTTGSEAYAQKALKLDAVDYLLKPIDPTDFLAAVAKARVRLALPREPVKENRSFSKVPLPSQNGIIYLEENNILHIIGMGSYSEIITIDKEEKIIVSKSIGHLEEKLSGKFFRCHNAHIINLVYVNNLINKDGLFVLMKNGTYVEVSRKNKKDLLSRLANN